MANAAQTDPSIQLSVSTSVHTEETTPPTAEPSSYREKLVARGPDEYSASLELYDDVDLREYSEYWYAMRGCRTDAWFAVSIVTRKVTVLSNSCRLRWCPICSASRAHTIAHHVREWLTKKSKPKLLTLTLKHSDESLDSQITRLYACFSAFRRRKWFSSKVRGGIWFFQIKQTGTAGEWHPHLHCLLNAEFMHHKQIRGNWLNVTGNSDIVDIRAIWNTAKAADYVSRYAARPSQLSKLDRASKLVLYDALKGRRLCGTWGEAKSVQLSQKTNGEFKDAVNVMTWKSAQFLIHSDSYAKAIYEAYKSGEPLSPSYSLSQIENFSPDEYTPREPEPPPPQTQLPLSDWCRHY